MNDRHYAHVFCRSVIVANKMDRPLSTKHLDELTAESTSAVMPISARAGTGVLELTALLRSMVEEGRVKPDIEKQQKDEFQQYLFASHKKTKSK